MGGGLSHFTRSNFYVIKKVPKQWEHWEDIPKSWNYSTQEVDYNFNSWDFNIWAIEKDDNKLMTLSFMIIYSHNIPGFYNIRRLIHDLEHPGTNNLYQINAGTTLAVRYNDLAVLENHHCARAFELFNQPALNIFAALTSDQRRSARKYIIAMVLATDMSVHFSLKDEVENCVSRLIPLQQALPPDTTIKIEEKDALTIMKAIVHTADISNPAKRWEVSRKWSDRVNEEFFLQGDREKKESLAISPGCDRSIASQDEGSINFTDFIVAPFYFSITKLLPKAMKACRLLEDNRNTWNNILTQRLNSTQAESKVDEIIVKWESRKAAFTEKMKDLQACSAARVSADL
eukprot:scaffold2602_cov177-Ochromonas_danica.AAC.11